MIKVHLSTLILSVSIVSCTSIDDKDTKGKFDASDSLETTSTIISPADSIASELIQEVEKESHGSAPLVSKYFHPNMSRCGGALYGNYLNDELFEIESSYNGEFSYSTKNVEFVDGQVVSIDYHEHLPDYDKFRTEYPDENGIIREKLRFTDTTYRINFEKNTSKKYSKEKLISEDVPQALIDRLLECALSMKAELESEKELVSSKPLVLRK